MDTFLFLLLQASIHHQAASVALRRYSKIERKKKEEEEEGIKKNLRLIGRK